MPTTNKRTTARQSAADEKRADALEPAPATTAAESPEPSLRPKRATSDRTRSLDPERRPILTASLSRRRRARRGSARMVSLDRTASLARKIRLDPKARGGHPIKVVERVAAVRVSTSRS